MAGLGPVGTYILTNYRSLITVLFLMPMSFFFEIYWQLKTYYKFHFQSDPSKHGKRVAEIQDQVRKWAKEGNGKQMCTARPTWQTISSKVATYKKRMHPIRVELNDILEVNIEKGYIRVEPGVTMGQIYKYLIPQGWTLPVNPELDELSIGGLINGYGIETSSHKHGLFLEVMKQVTLVVPSGELLVCNERENEKVFRCVPWSYGTLGFLVNVDLAIIPARKYVRLTYIPCFTLESLVQTYTHYQADPNPPEFLEGIMFSRDVGVVTVGDQTDKAEGGKVNKTWWWKPYFFEQCKSTLQKPTEVRTDYIPLADYYRRHNRSIFWDLYDICPATEWTWFRVAFGWMLPPRIPMIKYCQTDTLAKFYEENYALQDFLVPLNNMKEIIEMCHRELRVYPLWLCPMRVQHTGKHQGFMVPKDPNVKPGEFQQYVDAATVGPPGLPIQLFDMRRAITTIEDYMRKNRGYQGNYGYTYQTRDEYREMYNHTTYDEVRKELGADRAFPEPYDKVGRRGFQTFSEGKIEKKMN